MGVYAPNNPVRTSVIAWKWGSYLGEEALEEGSAAKISSFARHHINISLAKGEDHGPVHEQRPRQARGQARRLRRGHHARRAGLCLRGVGREPVHRKHGVLITPDLSSSILEGITRDTVLALAREEKIPVAGDPAHARPAVARRRGLLHGHRGGGHTDSRGRQPRHRRRGLGPITKRLQARFFDVVRGGDTAHPEWLTRV